MMSWVCAGQVLSFQNQCPLIYRLDTAARYISISEHTGDSGPEGDMISGACLVKE